eukprot:ANDGO_02917.mRNA.1 Cell number regulator 3
MSGPYAAPPAQQAQPNPYASAPAMGAPAVVAQAPMSDYSSGLCSCMEDFGVCCYGWCCFGCSMMETKAALEKRPMEGMDWCLGCLLWAAGMWWVTFAIPVYVQCQQRKQMRQQFGFPDNGDCLVSCCCLPCAVCQNAREITHRKAIGQLAAPVPKTF